MLGDAGTGNHSSGIREGLLARGWHENPDGNSPFFDFKWSINPLDISQESLWPAQVYTHTYAHMPMPPPPHTHT